MGAAYHMTSSGSLVVLNAVTSFDVALGWVLGVFAVLGTVAGFFRWVLPRFRETKKDLRAFRDAILGREAINHPDTGVELAPPIPGIGNRMANQEQQMSVLTEAVSAIAGSHKRIDDLEERMGRLEQNRDLERIVGKAESIQMFKTIETVANAQPPDDDEPQD